MYNLIEKFKQVKEEKIVEEARTRMRTRSENLYSKKMVKVYIMYIYIYIYIYIKLFLLNYLLYQVFAPPLFQCKFPLHSF